MACEEIDLSKQLNKKLSKSRQGRPRLWLQTAFRGQQSNGTTCYSY